jgi:down-regulator of transcription 1
MPFCMDSREEHVHRIRNTAEISPAATVQKIITEILPPSDGQVFARDARDLLIECCVEFVTLISTEANDISEKEAKKTIAVDHIEKALTELGFADYVPEVLAVADEFKDQQKVGMGFRVRSRNVWLIIGCYRLVKSVSTRWRRVG